MSSVWGHNLKISLFGESHGPAVGVTLDGLPPGEPLDLDAAQAHLARRAPGGNIGDTPRREADAAEILSGVFNGRTTGTPLCAILRNRDTQSADYSTLEKPRPGHADLTGTARYKDANDPRGGGHFSGRLTAPLCFAGAVCLQILARRGIAVNARVVNHDEVMAAIRAAQAEGDSVGGIVECVATGVPAGLGDPIFGNVESRAASLLFAIPAVKGVEFGAGFGLARMRGSQSNDAPMFDEGGAITRASNNMGGIEGGITNGMPLVVRCVFKPVPSIAKPQATVNLATGKNDTIETKGRHDTCIVPRALPIVESAVAIAVLDLMNK